MAPSVSKIIITSLFLLAVVFGAKAQRTDDPPAVKEGLQIKRWYLIKQMQSADSTMVFKQEADINGEKNYIGVDANGTSLQFLGDEERLKKIIFTFKFTTNKEINNLQYRRMAYFTSLMSGKAGLAWLDECSSFFVKAPKSAFYNTKAFEYGVKGFYKYEPADKAMLLTFTSWEL
jgi:hypothetical protein